MILDIVMLAVGLLILVRAADHFVLGAARVAIIVRLPPIVIGAVVMGFGTSAPELVVSTIAAAEGDLALGVGNVIGSNVANLSLVLATAAMVTRMNVGRAALRKEGPLSIAATFAFALVVSDGAVGRWEGGLLAIGLVGAIVYLITTGDGNGVDELEEGTSTRREILRVAMGLAGTVVAAQLVVSGATGSADRWGLSGGFVGFSLVALGTSLPELVTTLAAARRHETQLIIGNLLGSNVFNSLAVGGSLGLVGPGVIGDDILTSTGVVLMLVVAVGSFLLALRGRFVGRLDGAILFAFYLFTMVVLGTSADGDDDDASMVTSEQGWIVDHDHDDPRERARGGRRSVWCTGFDADGFPGAGEELWHCSID